MNLLKTFSESKSGNISINKDSYVESIIGILMEKIGDNNSRI